MDSIKNTIKELVLWQKTNKRALKRAGMYGSFSVQMTIEEAECILSILNKHKTLSEKCAHENDLVEDVQGFLHCPDCGNHGESC